MSDELLPPEPQGDPPAEEQGAEAQAAEQQQPNEELPGSGMRAGRAETAQPPTLMEELRQIVDELRDPAEPMPQVVEAAPDSRRDARPPALQVDHVADATHHYPGEEVVWSTRVTVLRECAGFTLRVSLPRHCRLLGAHGPASVALHATEVENEQAWKRWTVNAALPLGTRYLFHTELRVAAVEVLGDPPADAYSGGQPALVSTAEAIALAHDEEGGGALATVSETSVVVIRPRGKYLNYLPAVFERDHFMARFLMLFESFWGPIDQQADLISNYFDPALMPIEMVHWFAARFDLIIHDDWPPESKRRLLAAAVRLFRKRGTRAGLQEMLEIYSGGEVSITERRANNFRLGKSALLGQGVALGSQNRPHSFGVQIRLPALPDDPERPEESERLRVARRARISAIIDAEKPAHVTYTLLIQEE